MENQITLPTLHKSTWYVLSAVLTAALGSLFFGFFIGAYNPAQSCIEIVNGWSDSEKDTYSGLATALMPIGAVFGAFLCGFLGSSYGRWTTFMVTDLIGLVGAVLLIFKGPTLFIGRVVGGLAVGINSAMVPTYINEISPLKVSGVMGALTNLMINSGILVSFLLGLNLPKSKDIKADPDGQNWWRFMFGFPILICVLRMLLLSTVFRFDTPQSLISRGQEKKAKEIVRKIYLEKHYEEIFETMKAKIQKNEKSPEYLTLFKSKYRSRTIMGIMLSAVQQFSGVNAINFYSTKIFIGDKEENEIDPFDDKMAKIFTILIAIILIVSSYISGLICDRLGRKSILLLGDFFCIVTLLLLTIFGFEDLQEPSKYFILLFMFAFGISLGPVVWLYLPEILPEKGVSIAALANWVFCGIIGFCFPIVNKNIKIQGSFLIFLICCVLSFLYVFFFVKETKGKSSEEIERMFTGDKGEKKEEEEEGKKRLLSVQTA